MSGTSIIAQIFVPLNSILLAHIIMNELIRDNFQTVEASMRMLDFVYSSS